MLELDIAEITASTHGIILYLATLTCFTFLRQYIVMSLKGAHFVRLCVLITHRNIASYLANILSEISRYRKLKTSTMQSLSAIMFVSPQDTCVCVEIFSRISKIS